MTDAEFADAVADAVDGDFIATWGKKLIRYAVLQLAPKIPANIRSVMLDAADGINDAERKLWVDKITAEADRLIKLPMILEPFDDDFIRPLVERMFTFLQSGLAIR